MSLLLKTINLSKKDGKLYKENKDKTLQEIDNDSFIKADEKFDVLNISGTNFFKYFFDKLSLYLKDNSSEFNERVTVTTINYDNKVKLEDNQYIGYISYEFSVTSSQNFTTLIDRVKIECTNYKSKINPTEKLLKTLIQNAYSGAYRSIFDFEDLYNAMKDSGFTVNENYYPFYCEKCKTDFDTARELINHLKKEKHNSHNLKKDFPFCEDVQKL
jgi:arabinogalactan endo-1,4-beta-galactosidase